MAFQRRRRVKPVAEDRPKAISFTPFLGMILIVSSFFVYTVGSAQVAPWWAVVVLTLVWLVLFVLCCVWWSAHPKRLVWIGVLSYPLWFCLLVGGAFAFGWNA